MMSKDNKLICFETAVIAKELGYAEYGDMRYGIPPNVFTPTFIAETVSAESVGNVALHCQAPSHGTLQSWLRDTYRFNIAIIPNEKWNWVVHFSLINFDNNYWQKTYGDNMTDKPFEFDSHDIALDVALHLAVQVIKRERILYNNRKTVDNE